MRYRSFKGFIFDVDGVLCRGEEPTPGAREVIEKLREVGKRVVFLSNLSTKSREDYLSKFERLGIPVDVDDLVLATSATASYIAKVSITKKVYWVGAQGLRGELEKAGLKIVDFPEDAEYVVSGSPFDEKGFVTQENLWKFTGALRSIKAGARFVIVNPDRVFPAADGKLVPGTGAFASAVTAMTGREPDAVIGKPSPIIVQMALDKIGLRASECVMVGDQLETDIKAGKDAGVLTVLVLTGVTSLKDVEKSDIKPDFIFEDVGGVLSLT